MRDEREVLLIPQDIIARLWSSFNHSFQSKNGIFLYSSLIAHYSYESFCAVRPFRNDCHTEWKNELLFVFSNSSYRIISIGSFFTWGRWKWWRYPIGKKDTVVPVEQTIQAYEKMRILNADTRITLYPEANHDSCTQTFNNDEIYKWLLSHRLSEQTFQVNSLSCTLKVYISPSGYVKGLMRLKVENI